MPRHKSKTQRKSKSRSKSKSQSHSKSQSQSQTRRLTGSTHRKQAMEAAIVNGYKTCLTKQPKAKCDKALGVGLHIGCLVAPEERMRLLAKDFGVTYSKNRPEFCERFKAKAAPQVLSMLKKVKA